MIVACNFIKELKIQRFYPDFEWLLLSFGTQGTPFTDTSRSEAAVWNYGKILKN